MRMEAVCPHLDVDRRTVGDAFQQLDAEGGRLQQEAVPSLGSDGMYHGVEPVGDMDCLARTHEELGDFFLLIETVPHRLANLDIEGEFESVHPGIQDGRHPVGPCLAVSSHRHERATYTGML